MKRPRRNKRLDFFGIQTAKYSLAGHQFCSGILTTNRWFWLLTIAKLFFSLAKSPRFKAEVREDEQSRLKALKTGRLFLAVAMGAAGIQLFLAGAAVGQGRIWESNDGNLGSGPLSFQP
jgi:hypothetical protein